MYYTAATRWTGLHGINLPLEALALKLSGGCNVGVYWIRSANYGIGANITGIIKVVDAMLDQGVVRMPIFFKLPTNEEE